MFTHEQLLTSLKKVLKKLKLNKIKLSVSILAITILLSAMIYIVSADSTSADSEDEWKNICTCAILDKAGATYTLTANIINNSLTDDCIRIVAPDITLDGAGYSISSDDDYAGIYSNQPNTTIKSCNVSMSVNTLEGEGYGLKLVGADNSHIFDNTFHSSRWGIRIWDSEYVTIENNVINSNKLGIKAHSLSHSNIVNNDILSNRHDGIQFLEDSSYNIIEDNTITYVNDSDNADGLAILGNSANNIFKNNTVHSCSRCVFVGSGSPHNLFINNSIANCTYHSVYIRALNTTFLNCRYDISKEKVGDWFYGGELKRKWHYRAHVKNTEGADIFGAKVVAYSVLDDLIEDLTTDAGGWTELGELIDYINSDGTRTYYSNYTISASKSGYTESHIHNITEERNIYDDTFTLADSDGS